MACAIMLYKPCGQATRSVNQQYVRFRLDAGAIRFNPAIPTVGQPTALLIDQLFHVLLPLRHLAAYGSMNI
jgi:hypothetical protein